MEFALVIPIFLTVLFGIITFGLLFAQDLALSNAARQAARYAAVPGHDCAAVRAEAKAAAAPLVTLTDANITIGPNCGSSNGEPCLESTTGADATVSVTFTANVLLPVPGMGSSTVLDGNGAFRCEFS